MPKKVNAKSLSAWYDSREDRLRLAANLNEASERIDFWITRRFLLSMLSEASEYLMVPPTPSWQGKGTYAEKGSEPPSSEKENASLTEESSRSTAPEPLHAEVKDFPVELLERLQIRQQSDGRADLILRSTGQTASATLRPPELRRFFQMLLQKAPTIEWGISPHLWGL